MLTYENMGEGYLEIFVFSGFCNFSINVKNYFKIEI